MKWAGVRVWMLHCSQAMAGLPVWAQDEGGPGMWKRWWREEVVVWERGRHSGEISISAHAGQGFGLYSYVQYSDRTRTWLWLGR
jgi:hypothetical protein